MCGSAAYREQSGPSCPMPPPSEEEPAPACIVARLPNDSLCMASTTFSKDAAAAAQYLE